jgi:putative transposase
MPRKARQYVPDVPHHVTQRGNNRQDVFFTEDDRRLYLSILHEKCIQYGFDLLGYCLMTNHVHIIGVPRAEDSLSKAVGRTHWRYTQILNKFHGRCGHFWQNRFHSCTLDGPHLLRAMAYIERNPVRARLTRFAWTYPWSSAQAHVLGKDKERILNLDLWKKMCSVNDWKAALKVGDEEDFARQLVKCSSRGRPLASDAFISKLETAMGKRLRPLPVGRPRKQTG